MSALDRWVDKSDHDTDEADIRAARTTGHYALALAVLEAMSGAAVDDDFDIMVEGIAAGQSATLEEDCEAVVECIAYAYAGRGSGNAACVLALVEAWGIEEACRIATTESEDDIRAAVATCCGWRS